MRALRPYRILIDCLILIFLGTLNSNAQLVVVDQVGPVFLVNNVLVGDKGIGVQNISYKGYDRAKGYFEKGNKADLGLDRGVILSSGISLGCKGPNDKENYTSGRGGAGSPTLDAFLAGGTKTIDASTLSFDFKPQTKQVVFNYIFSSEEYVEWIDSGFNDIFGFFVSGPGIIGKKNVALIPGTTDETSIDNVNPIKNANYFIHNNDRNSIAYKYLQHDGQTVVLQAILNVQPCEWYTIELAIADVGDDLYDSWVFLQAGSFKHNTGLGPDTTYCYPNFTRVLDAGHPNKRVRWSTGETTQTITVDTFGTYWVEIFTACGSFKDEIVIGPTVEPISIGSDTAICGNDIDLTLGVAGRSFEKYLWSTGDTSSTLRVQSEGQYSLEVRNKDCPRSDTIQITAMPYPAFNLGADTVYCGDFTHDLGAGIVADTYSWSDGSSDSSKTVDTPGWQTLTVIRNGCSFTDSILLDRENDFTFDMGPPKIEQCGADEIVLSTGIRDSIRYSTQWSTGDTSHTITINESGVYSVTVRSRSCLFEQSDEVEVIQFAGVGKFYVPNAFTPNGDELNNVLQPLQSFTAIKGYSLRIFDLWGNMVFETDNPQSFWDGKVDGERPIAEVYIWTISIRSSCLSDNEQHQSGTIMILN
jgi:gliding motility-associated-like protein